MALNLDKEIEEVRESIDSIVEEYKDEGSLDDANAQKIADTMQWIEEKLVTLLAQHGFEVGDERVD